MSRTYLFRSYNWKNQARNRKCTYLRSQYTFRHFDTDYWRNVEDLQRTAYTKAGITYIFKRCIAYDDSRKMM